MQATTDAAVPEPSAIRAKAAEILARDDYQIDVPVENRDWMLDVIFRVIGWLLTPLRWVYELTEGLPEFARWLLVIGLVVLLVLILAHIIYTLIAAARNPLRGGTAPYEAKARVLDPDEWEREADRAFERADYITAVRMLFRADVTRLERHEKKPNRPGTTNRELLYRYRHLPEPFETLRLLVDTIDRKWYGDETCSIEDYTVCRQAHERLRQFLEGALHAVSA